MNIEASVSEGLGSAGTPSSGLYTAAQYSARLGMTPQAVRKALRQVPAGGVKIVSGIETAAWSVGQLARGSGFARQSVYAALERAHILPAETTSPEGKDGRAYRFEDLPLELQEAITRRGVKRGFEDGEQFLSNLSERAFQRRSAKPVALHDEYRHEALGETFAAVNNRQALTVADRELVWRESLLHYKGVLDTIPDSPENRRERRRLRDSVAQYLFDACPAGTLCSSLRSIKERLAERFDKWRRREFTLPGLVEAARDNRPMNSGKFRATTFEQDLPRLYERAELLHNDFERALTELMAEGKVSIFAKDLLEILREALRWEQLTPAYRELREQGRLSKEFCDLYPFNARKAKSAVPKAIRKVVEPMLAAALVWKHGPKRARLVSPPVRRDWSDTAPGDSTVYDDATPDHAIFGQIELPLAYDDNPKTGLYVGRMELLLGVDERTDYPKAFLIILGEPGVKEETKGQKAHYNMVHQRLVMIREHDSLGLPHKWYKLENGPWRNRLNDGESVQHWDNIDYVNFANGLARATGRVVRHTIPGNPRSKIVERVFQAVWSRMKRHPGYLGNNERLDRREAVQDFLRRVKNNGEHPGNELLSVSEYRQVLDEELMAFAGDVQNGARLPDVSPKDAWLHGIDGCPGVPNHPLTQIPATARWVFSTHERSEKVKANRDNASGITFNIGRIPYYFWGTELEPYQNQIVQCRFNFEEPGLLSCQAGDGNQFIVKARVNLANTEPKESLARTAQARGSWMRRGKIIHDGLQHEVVATVIRDQDFPAAVHEIGQVHNEETARAKAEESDRGRKLDKVRRKAKLAGIPIPDNVRNPDDALEAIDRRAYYLQKMREEEETQA